MRQLGCIAEALGGTVDWSQRSQLVVLNHIAKVLQLFTLLIVFIAALLR